jgi:hypothetical protein
MNFTTFKYNDCTITVEWSELFDGKWPHKEENIIIIKNYNFYD